MCYRTVLGQCATVGAMVCLFLNGQLCSVSSTFSAASCPEKEKKAPSSGGKDSTSEMKDPGWAPSWRWLFSLERKI